MNIQKLSSINNLFIPAQNKPFSAAPNAAVLCGNMNNLKSVNADNLKAYHPSFTALKAKTAPAVFDKEAARKLKAVKSALNKESLKQLESLQKKGILLNNNSNDSSSVLDNLYKIAAEPRIEGLNSRIILAETIKALDNPYSITQKFGDIPKNAAYKIQEETGINIPESAKNIVSSSCVAASIEFSLADRYPAEFARFAADLSCRNYSIDKLIKMSDFSDNMADGLWKLREFNTINKIGRNGSDVLIKLKPDRNAIVRARVQTSYKDKGERSCVDVLIQSAILNFASQNTYDSLTDERTGKYNPDKTGLTDFEKNFAEQVIFETPKLSAVYQNLDEDGVLQGYNGTHEETKQHILKSLELGQNVIIGYTHMNEEKKVNGGHEITITGFEKDKSGNLYFICNDTDDGIDKPVTIRADKLIPLIHHAGISKEALSKQDVIMVPWKEHLAEFKNMLAAEKNRAA